MKLSVKHLTVERAGRTLFAPLSFVVEGGTLVRVTGVNGAGKTTLLRVLAGLAQAASGELTWLHDVGDENSWARRIFIGHSNAMNDSLTPFENWKFAEGAVGQRVTVEDCARALGALGVASLIHRSLGTLSQGQKKRVALARLLLPSNANSVWLLDEPFVALDSASQTLLASLIEAALQRGAMVVLTSHQTVPLQVATQLEVSLDRVNHERAV